MHHQRSRSAIFMLFFISVFIFTPIASMNQHNHDQEVVERQTYYKNACDAIDQELTAPFKVVANIISAIPDKNRVIDHLHKKINFYAIEIAQQKQRMLNAVKNEFKIKDSTWCTALTFIAELKEYNQFYHQQKLPAQPIFKSKLCNTTHIIQSLLADNGINPDKVIITYKSGKKSNHYSECLAESKSPGAMLAIDKKYIDLLKPPQFNNGTITIYPSFVKYEETMLQAMCLHEVSHIVQQHSTENVILSSFVSAKTHKTVDEIKHSFIWKQLMRIEEAETEIIPATQCHLYAHLLVKLRRKQYYPECLFINHYRKLKKILLYWELIARLERK